MEEFKMSDLAVKDGTLEISKEAHIFLEELEYNPKKQIFDQIKFFGVNQKNDIFKLGFSIGYVRGLEFRDSEAASRMTIAPRGFAYDAYRTFLEDEAVQRKMSIGGLLSAYANAGLLHLKEHLDSGKSILDLFDS
tara:strand:- start:373 stop:777 length:405 start_codon:yes stop_codon:yes gene_type:complete